MHDDFCTSQDDAEDCSVCKLIKRVRRDERDAIEGDSELGIDEIKEAAYQNGFADGKATVKPTQTVSSGIPLADMKAYILENLHTYNEQQMSALYQMYVKFGGS